MLKPDLYIENKMILDTKWKIQMIVKMRKTGYRTKRFVSNVCLCLQFKIYDIKLVYPLCEKLKIYKEKSQKNFCFKASEHLYFKEQGQKI